MHLPDPTFPPLFKGHSVKAPLHPADEAMRRAESGELGAGDVLWARDTSRADLAIILEPEVNLASALQMGPLLTLATVDALAALCPPKVAIQHYWPGDILLNGATAGRVRVHAPPMPFSEVPPWLVISVNLAIAGQDQRSDWSHTALAEEVSETITRTDLVEAIAAHFLRRLHAWGDEGFRGAHPDWLFRVAGREAPLCLNNEAGPYEATVIGLADDAALMLKAADGRVIALPFAPHIVWSGVMV